MATKLSSLQLGGTTLLTLAVGVAGYFLGTTQVTGPVDFQQTGNSSGAVLQVAGVTRYKHYEGICTATGGKTTYSSCSIVAPFSTSGALLGFSLEAGNMAVALVGDVSFKKSATSASGTALTNGNNISVGSGALTASMLAVPVVWNSADILTFTTIVTPTGTLNTTRYDLSFWAIVYDKDGS